MSSYTIASQREVVCDEITFENGQVHFVFKREMIIIAEASVKAATPVVVEAVVEEVKPKKDSSKKNLARAQKKMKKALEEFDSAMEVETGTELYISATTSTDHGSEEEATTIMSEIVDPILAKCGFKLENISLTVDDEGVSFDIDFSIIKKKRSTKKKSAKKTKTVKKTTEKKERKKSVKKARPSPSTPAKECEVGHEEVGSDGVTMYVVKSTTAGQHRWYKVTASKKKTTVKKTKTVKKSKSKSTTPSKKKTKKVKKTEEVVEEKSQPDGDYTDIDAITESLRKYLANKSDDKWESNLEDNHNNVICVTVAGETECEYDQKYLKKMTKKMMEKHSVAYKTIDITIVEDELVTIRVSL